MPFDLIIFDYDGVLVDSLDEVINASRDFCQSIGHERMLSKEIVTTLQPMTYAQLARSIGLHPERMELFSKYVFNRLQQADAAMPFFPGIKALLSQRTSENTVIISGNSREVISAKLSKNTLDRHIGHIFGAYEPGNKAHKIRQACDHFEADPARTCMVGDSVSDIRYAKQAGVQSVAVTWGWQTRDTLVREQPDFIVESVSELETLLS